MPTNVQVFDGAGVKVFPAPTDNDGTELQQSKKSDSGKSLSVSTDSKQEPRSPRSGGGSLKYSFSTFTDFDANGDLKEVHAQWQWHHTRTDQWRDYAGPVNKKIERAYQRGDQKVRVKTGKQGKTPMAIFFNDMLQYDPATHGTRLVKRVPLVGGKLFAKVETTKVFFRRLLRSWRTGRPRFESYENFVENKLALYTEDIAQREYNVFDFYHEDGWCAAIARSFVFYVLTMSLVIFNTIWIAYDIDRNKDLILSDTEPHFQAVEHSLCVAFSAELLIRFCAFQKKRDTMKDAWFRLDFFVLIIMVLDTWLIPIIWVMLFSLPNTEGELNVLRIARLLRLFRVTRLLQAASEIVTLLKGIAAACRSVLCTLGLLFLVLYVAAIAVRVLVVRDCDTERMFFSSVPHTMSSLLLHCTLLDSIGLVLNSSYECCGLHFALLLLCVVFFSSFTVLNMLIGILCEVVSDVSSAEAEAAEVTYLRTNLLELMEAYDANDNKCLGREEFNLLMVNPDVHDVLQRFGTDPQGLLAIADIMFDEVEHRKGAADGAEASTIEQVRANTQNVQRIHSDRLDREDDVDADADDGITFTQFMNVVRRLRGVNSARVTDIVELREYTRQCTRRLGEKLNRDFEDLLAIHVQKTNIPYGIPEGNELPSPPMPPPGRELMLVRLSLGEETVSHRHRESLTIGELLAQLTSEYGPVKATDASGAILGRELQLHEVLKACAGQTADISDEEELHLFLKHIRHEDTRNKSKTSSSTSMAPFCDIAEVEPEDVLMM